VGAGAPAAWADIPPGTFCQLPATGQSSARPWAQQQLDPERVWPLTTGAGITVAVVDTGVDAGQPFLAHHVVRPGVDVVNGGGADTDCVGHGTLIAGLIAGQPQPGSGFSGVAPGVSILPVRQANTELDGTPHTLALGIDAAVNAHAQVINVSIVTTASTPELAGAVANALSHGAVIVAAAGNDQQKGNMPEYPAAYPGVISVGAIGSDGQADSFSSSGTPVSVVAPGSDLVGPGAGGAGLIGGQQGTSFSAAFVSAVAALVLAYHPGLSPAQVAHRIEATAVHPAAALPDGLLGWGTLDPYQAVTAVLPEEGGATAAAQAVTRVALAHPAPVDDRTEINALRLAVSGAALVVAIALTALVSRRIRGRGRGAQTAAGQTGR
jgi:type VII secretion-associated serine protease mycosin